MGRVLASLWCVETKYRLEGSSESSDNLFPDQFLRTRGLHNGDLRRADSGV